MTGILGRPVGRIVVPASDFCMRWRDRRHSWRHRSEGGFDRRRYDVGPLSEADARAFVVANHYSGSYPAARLRYGLYDGPWLVGVAVLAVPMRAAVLTSVFPELEPLTESLELARFVLAEAVPANAETWFLARAWELAAAVGVRGVVSFSDPVPRATADGRVVMPGHVGLIYQAGGATYHGRSATRTLHLLPDGRTLSARTLQKVRAGERGSAAAERLLVGFGARTRRPGEDRATWLRHALVAVGVQRIRHGGCHRYAFRIGPQRRLIALGMPVSAAPCPCEPCRERVIRLFPGRLGGRSGAARPGAGHRVAEHRSTPLNPITVVEALPELSEADACDVYSVHVADCLGCGPGAGRLCSIGVKLLRRWGRAQAARVPEATA